MNFGDVISRVRNITEDMLGSRWGADEIAGALSDACRRVSAVVGRSKSRVTLNLISGTESYTVPTGTSRIRTVRVLGRSGTGATTLMQSPYEALPLDGAVGDPRYFAIQLGFGATLDQFGIVLYPTPDRTQPDAVLLDVEDDFEFSAVEDNIPFPPPLHTILVRLAAAELLKNEDDAHDIEKALNLQRMAEIDLSSIGAVDTISLAATVQRRFP